MYKPHTVCRACGNETIPTLKQTSSGGPQLGSDEFVKVFDLGIQPLANDFTNPNGMKAGYAPLEVLFCPKCTLAQLSVNVAPQILYANYCYVTSNSMTMRKHWERLISDIKQETQRAADCTSLLEIGSNDGGLLEFFSQHGFTESCGIDPAQNLCDIAKGKGLHVHCNFFGAVSALDISESFPDPDVILARHVFCHCPDWHDFVAGLDAISGPDTVIFIEVPYVGDLLANGEFDTVYHEHLSFLSVRSVVALLKDSNFKLTRIYRYQIHGGAIALVIRPKCSTVQPHSSVADFLEAEKTTVTVEAWEDFELRALDMIAELRITVGELVNRGKRVAALGASAKSTVWINACEFTKKEIKFIADCTPQKQYKVSPGAGIPIVDEGAILRDLPDFVICFAWNFKEEILYKNARARELGVKFIFPVPKLTIE